MDCVFARGNANVGETGPFPSKALRAERVECRRPSKDPWTAKKESVCRRGGGRTKGMYHGHKG